MKILNSKTKNLSIEISNITNLISFVTMQEIQKNLIFLGSSEGNSYIINLDDQVKLIII